MAITQTTYTGNGSTTNYSFTFEYLKQADVKVTLDTTATTAFTFANATTLAFTSAPANGVAIRIFRDTVIDTLSSTFFPGSAIKAEDLNENFTQNLYVTQESDAEASTATTTANGAVTTANAATATANGAVTTANSAETKSDAAVATANTSNTNSTAAVATANTASSNATAAVNTANTASANATTAVNTANAATATANTALTNSRESDGSGGFNTAISIANTASTTAGNAVTTANTANTNSTSAVNTANAATTTAGNAVTTANGAVSTANTASTNATTAVNTANAATTTANTADTNATAAVATANTASTNASSAVTTANSADANATTALTNSRESDGSGGFTSAISKANTAITTANAASSAVSNAVLFTLIANVAAIPGSPSNNDYIEIGNSTGIESFSPLSGLPSGFVGATGLTVRLTYSTSGSSWVFMSYFANDSESRYLTRNIPVVTGDSTNGSGQITLNCENNSHGIKLKGPPHSAGANYTITLPNDTGTNGQALITNGSGVTSWSTTVAGRDVSADGTKLDGIETAATADQTAAEILTAIKTVDGGSSGLDADLLDGQHGSYYTGYTDTAVANIVDSSPATLDTLNELAAALGDDPNFATTTANSIGTKLPLAGGTLTGGLTGTTATFAGGALAIASSGNLSVNRTAGTNDVFNGKLNGTVTSTINADGSAIFAGSIELGADPVAGNDEGVFIGFNGDYQSCRAASTNTLFTGYLKNTAAPTVTIKADGSATFADDVQGQSFIGDRSTGGNAVFAGKQNGTQTTRINADGSATFAASGSFGNEVYVNGSDASTQRYLNFSRPTSGQYRATLRRDAWYLGETVTNIGNVTPSGANITLKMNGDATFAGTVSDSLGPLRRLGVHAHASSSYTLEVGDTGKIVREATSGATLTIIQNRFTAGDMITVFNVSSGNITIAQGSGTTIYNTADAATGNRTIAAKGMATIVCTTSNEFAISGSQLT